MLTPIEIRQQTFNKQFRGYDKVEVDAFLQEVANVLEQEREQSRSIKEELEKLKASYDTLKEVENMLHKTLMQAEQSSRSTVENARHKAELKVQEAEAKAREIVQRSVNEREKVEREIEELDKKRVDILTQLQVFLQTQLGTLETYEHKSLPEASSRLIAKNGNDRDDLFTKTEVKNGSVENAFFDDIADEL